MHKRWLVSARCFAAPLAAGLVGLALLLAAPPSAAAPLTDEALGRIEALTGDYPDQALAQLNALEAEARKAPPKRRAAYLSLLGYTQALAGVPESALQTARELATLAADNQNIAAEAELVRANALLVNGKLEEAARAANAGRNQLGNDAPPRLLYWAENVLGAVAHQQGHYDIALGHLQQAVRIAEDNSWLRRKTSSQANLASLFVSLRQYDRALVTINQASATARANEDTAALANCKLIESNIHNMTGERAAQRTALGEALRLARASRARATESAALINLSNYFLLTGEYREAIAHAELAQPIAQSFQDWAGEATIQTNIGLARVLSGDTAAGRRQIDKALQTYADHGARNDEIIVLQEYGDALRKIGQSDAALEILMRERALSEELFQTEKQRVVLELQARYEADKQQREIALLNRENALKDAEISNHRLEQRVWWLLMIVGALAATVVGLLYRRVRTTNQQLAERNAELAIQSSRDPLTGLYNRRHFQQRMAQLDAQPEAQVANTVRATYLIDIDHFKRINDRLGHPAGDAVLIEVASRLRGALPEADMVVRWGGEEFLVFMPSVRLEQMQPIAQRIIEAISAHPVPSACGQIPVTASVGYAPYPLSPGDVRLPWEREINLIDMALYLAKAHGRSRAYGVARLLTGGESNMEVIERDLEQAWSNGLVELLVTEGPPPSPVD
ncbi:GGDEF domain-containing protein [Niveibacterium sp. 24ML]|uniref:tetratricopeptide repeat-containing diguanylate cyclase n=1 Tax=Niveibacterium sp. 24ML TaxID=2985512 RepID=UPI00226D963A|nr:GGDEF domain-containing protein [Niveibacterium sp. 24ML]MCX9158371.1 GGDEF domain-containing protein [Niveibacterium sp. 24ML]